MAASVAFPSSIDAPLGLTLASGAILPDHLNTADQRAIAVETKVGVTGSADPQSLDYRVRGLETYGATALRGVPIDTPAPTDGQVLTYSLASGKWRAATAGGGALPTASAAGQALVSTAAGTSYVAQAPLTAGLDAARPAASAQIVGQSYYATDTQITYLCVSSTTWIIQIGAPRRVPTDANDVLVWTLDEASGSFANSGSGSAYALAIQTVAARDASGIHGGCVSIPLTGHGALVGSGSGPTLPTTGVSVSFWIRPRSIPPYGRLVEKSFDATAWASPFSSLGADWNNGSPWRAWVTTGTTQRTVIAPTTLVLNVWHHVGWTYDGATLVMYVDGDAVASATYSGTIAYGTSPGPWAIGNTNTGLTGTADQPADSRFDDVRIANVTRPASYFAQVWSRGHGYGAP